MRASVPSRADVQSTPRKLRKQKQPFGTIFSHEALICPKISVWSLFVDPLFVSCVAAVSVLPFPFVACRRRSVPFSFLHLQVRGRKDG